MAGSGGVNMEKFEEYFQRADLDRDGRISGAEAVSFLTGSGLPRQVLAQIWMHADQNQSGFLNRPQFYNALKLVTVAQSKRELTPDIIKAALYGPASAKIPAPQINTNATPVVVPNSAASPLPQTGADPRPTQNFGFRGPVPSVTTVNQQFGIVSSATGLNQQVRPAHLSGVMNRNFGQAPSNLGVNPQFGQIQPTRSININHESGLLQSSSTGLNQQFGQAPLGTNMNQQFFPSQSKQITRPPLSMSTGPVSHLPQAAGSPNVSRDLGVTGHSNSSNDWLGAKIGAASIGLTAQGSDTVANFSMSSISPNSQNLLSTVTSTASNDIKGLTSAENRSVTSSVSKGDAFSDLFKSQKFSAAPEHNISSLSPVSAIVPVTPSPQTSVKPDPFEVLQSTFRKPPNASEAAQTSFLPKANQQASSSVVSSVGQVGAGNSTMEQPQNSWPKMTRAGIQKYAKVFSEVDNDRDGKISGDQARNLFLSWRLPREVLKQVWDLSDQDGDSMLTLREFCIALYLMERYREGSSLPSMLPNSVVLDETLLSLTGPSPAHVNIGWGPSPTTGLRPQQGLPGAQPVATAGFRPQMQPTVSQPDESFQFNQRNATGALSDNLNSNKMINGDVNTLETDDLKAEENGKIDDKEKVILDSREKLEFYRKKMQDLVLYKSRCDNRLNEITERARADKSEAELLEKKYQEKYKQVAEIHSKLTLEESSFREIQGRKMELQEAIIKIEQGGSVDGILQVRADRMQSDFEELLKALAASSKKHSIDMKSSALMIELPTGWHPGIPEVAAIWDEEWDKFDDAGFSFDVALPESGKSESGRREDSPPTRSLSPESVLNVATSEELFGEGNKAFHAESMQITDEPKSPQDSPWIQTSASPREHPGNHFRKSSGDSETRRSFDEEAWGNFGNNDDIDSVWGFNTKDSDHGNHEEKYFFGSSDFNASPKRSESPLAESTFSKNNFFTYEDSVPGTPSNAGNSPRYSDVSRDPVFDSFRHDSFSMHDHVPSSDQGNLTRFDSMSSTMGFDHSSNFSFDDSDPFGSSVPFKASTGTPG